MKRNGACKKVLALVLSLALVFALAACGSGSSETTAAETEAETEAVTEAETEAAEEEEGEVLFANPGTYSATATGRNGDVVVTATFSAAAIEDISVESDETPTIGGEAMDSLTETILANQSLNVEAVSAATVSSNAFLAALKDCVEQAGGDVDALSGVAVAKDDEIVYNTEADIVVVGAGGAGLTAAVSASENGASVILLEKTSSVGGNTLATQSGINAVNAAAQIEAGSTLTVDDFIESQMNNDDAILSLVTVYCETSGEVMDWLAGQGVEFTADPEGFELSAQADGSTAITLVNAVYATLKNTDVDVYYNMDATELVTDENNAVTGVVAVNEDGEEITFNAKAVILCTGGYGQNSELVAELNPSLAGAITDEIAPTTGEGLLMAEAIGAATVNLDAMQTFPSVIAGYGMVLPPFVPNGCIYVNLDAERFAAESFEIPDAILAQEDGVVFAIFDEDGLNGTMQNLMGMGYVKSADTAEELAEELGLDPDALAATIEQWNADVEAGADSLYGRENLDTLDGTLYGYQFGVGIHFCMGGILINDATQVLDTDGNAITGLYAAGEVTGGFHGTYRVDGSGIGDAFVFGYLAGENAAAAVAE